ncbi:MAG: OmpH family outer membrane protein [Pseudomonadota bacterium]
MARAGWLRAGLLALALFGTASVVQAQEAPAPLALRSPVLTIESARLFPETELGRSILAQIAEEQRIFNIENQELADAFREEELALTDRRATLPRDEFAALAEDFDARVQAARRERDAREAEIEASADLRRRSFSQAVRPILNQIMREAGAAVLIEAETVLIRADAIDITDIAIVRIDAATELDPDALPEGSEGLGGTEPPEDDAAPEE